MTRTFQNIFLLFLCLQLFTVNWAINSCFAGTRTYQDASLQITVDIYTRIPCLTEDELAYGREVITGLNYNAKRIFRKICELPGINFENCKKIWLLLLEHPLTYEQVLAFEKWSQLEKANIELALTAIPAIKELNYEAGKSFRSYSEIKEINAEPALNIIPLLTRFDDVQNRAAQALFTINEIQAIQALDGLLSIAGLQKHQARAARAFASIKGMTGELMLDALPIFKQLHQDDAWNARTLYLNKKTTPQEAWFWLTGYFATPPDIQEKQFYKLSRARQKILLNAFYDAGQELIWKINNLHAITDRFGFEISNHELHNFSSKDLTNLFNTLSPQVTSPYSDRFYASNKKHSRIEILKEATGRERIETGRRLTSANIYTLLSQGSELYDSSFRNILVPVLKKRIAKNHNNNLLKFLQTVDQENQLVSDFIVSLAQKGKLTTFFPANAKEQEQILDLVTRSAFKSENSIILFSATFMHLLEVLKPPARSYLITKMSKPAQSGAATYSRLITVILQYYLQEYPELLGEKDRKVITRLIAKHGEKDLHRYLQTPFAHWKADGTLASISVFHPDDDGMASFRSNAIMLIKSGYKMELSQSFTITPFPQERLVEFNQIIHHAQANPSKWLSRLFYSMQQHHYAVAFVRKINGTQLIHSTFVYSGKMNQQILLERYIQTGVEMFAQRGHSYWRSEQITDPLHALMKNGKVTEQELKAKQRFLSLGSCGGVKAYTRLDRLFRGKVDILATIGTGLSVINDPYNKNFFEVIAKSPSNITWKDVSQKLAFIFKGGHGKDYLQPGSLPAILHKIMNENKENGSSADNLIQSKKLNRTAAAQVNNLNGDI